MTEPIEDFAAEAPPDGLSPPRTALWWLKKGGLATGPAWERAHEICQAQEGDPAHDRVHALAHWIEGDLSNSAYWYRRSGDDGRAADIAGEWERLVADIA